jgi:hypothetical protein
MSRLWRRSILQSYNSKEKVLTRHLTFFLRHLFLRRHPISLITAKLLLLIFLIFLRNRPPAPPPHPPDHAVRLYLRNQMYSLHRLLPNLSLPRDKPIQLQSLPTPKPARNDANEGESSNCKTGGKWYLILLLFEYQDSWDALSFNFIVRVSYS